MKKVKLNKLNLNKETIAKLNNKQMGFHAGSGVTQVTCASCNCEPPTMANTCAGCGTSASTCC